MQVIGALVDLVYKSIFQAGEEGLRRAHPASKLLYLALSAALLALKPGWEPGLLVLASSLTLGLYGFGMWWVVSSYTLSSIPGLWYSLTALLLSRIGYIGWVSPLEALTIYIRATSISLLLLLMLSSLSPTRLANALSRVSGRASLALYLTWRMTPYAFRSTVESLAIGRLKGEPARARIAPAIAYVLELGSKVREANAYRLRVSLKYGIPVPVSIKYTAVFMIASTIILGYTLLMLSR